MALVIQNGKIELLNGVQPLWSVPLEQLKLVGEFTTDEGPYRDDYFLIFGLNKSTLYQASYMQVKDPLTFWDDLNANLGTFEMGPELFATTTWASQIIFPQELKNEKLYEITFEPAKQSFLQRLFGIQPTTTKLELTEAAKQQLQSNGL